MPVTCGLCGGIGNQLFMIFNTISYAKETNTTFSFPDDACFPSNTTRYPYWDTLFTNLRRYVGPRLNTHTIPIREERHSYQPLPYFSVEENSMIVLHGYFQSEKYFKKHYQAIYDIIGFEEKKNVLRARFPVDPSLFISMHFRIGDYKKYTEYHPIMSVDYYKRALAVFAANAIPLRILYFFETEDTEMVLHMISAVKEEFPNAIFMSSKSYGVMHDTDELMLLSLCSHHIIANSTFSWWGAYLNSNLEKKIVYPSRWFGNGITSDVSDMFPEDWIKVDA